MATLAAALTLNAGLGRVYAEATGRHAVLVIDANTGRVLYERSADELRIPASLVKLMTLYVIFEMIETGQLSYKTRIRFSANAVGAAPSKLDVAEGTEIELIDAIKALITKSANDVAVALAEHISGNEERFAQLLTRKARQLGMAHTQFRNASGLPDDDQVTTARDMVTLALRLQDDFPAHYPLFATRTFTWGGDTFRNHNTLLFNYPGLDGMKTGYTRASGFNLVASVRRGKKHVIAAYFGGTTAALRNAAVRVHLDAALLKASEVKTRRPAALRIAQAKAVPATADVPAPQPVTRPPVRADVEILRVRPVSAAPAPVQAPPAPAAPASAVPPVKTAAPPAILPTAGASGAFHVQIGAFQSQGEAERRLASVRQQAGSLLAARAPFTTEVKLGERVLYRARYGGFDAQASAAVVCDALKRLSIECLVMKAE
jgi:D-alanyl-D-alanine carboxypeptidase